MFEIFLFAYSRELFEECSLKVNELNKAGIIKFEFVGQPQIMEVHVFRTNNYTGSPQESEEMRPKWFPNDQIPFSDMWPDDELWFPMLLNGEKFEGYFKFEGHDKILDYTLKKV